MLVRTQLEAYDVQWLDSVGGLGVGQSGTRLTYHWSGQAVSLDQSHHVHFTRLDHSHWPSLLTFHQKVQTSFHTDVYSEFLYTKANGGSVLVRPVYL